jgi:hypothetical protein
VALAGDVLKKSLVIPAETCMRSSTALDGGEALERARQP